MIFDNIYRNIRDDNYKFEFPLKDKFYVFKIENFLDLESFNFINKNFYNFSEKNLNQTFLKYSVKSNEESYQKNIKSNNHLLEIHKLFTSKEFSYFFFKKLYFKIIKSRLHDKEHLLRMFKFPNFDKPIKSRFVSNLETRIEYSFLANNAVINPHTDAVKKMISLMLYLPNDNESISVYEQEKFGTEFWDSKEENYINNHIQNIEDLKMFKKNNRLVYKAPFQKFHLYGFIKNKHSWHSVSRVKAPDNYLRRSININIFFV